ncbi:MAG: patatin-like phospholipase family protein [Bacteroidales bacterium]
MKKIFILFLVLIINIVPLQAAAQRGNDIAKNTKRPKVGLVLCGGGAKGAAHIGVLKVLEQANIPVDIIVGTSMGAIVGGMYSMGYDAHQLDSIISNCNWAYLLSDNTSRRDASFNSKMMDEKYLINIPFYSIGNKNKNNDPAAALLPGGFISGQNVLNLMSGLAVGYQDSINFNKLPIPFACVATNLSTGEEAILKDGYLPLSLRASMAIPGVFSPVTINGNVLVDGGMVNNFPVDVAKKLGADIIIGVDVQNDLAKPDKLKSINQVFSQIMGLMGNERYLENIKLTDIYIKPDVTDFSTFSFGKSAIDSLIVNGYIAATNKYSELEALAKKLDNNNSIQHRLKAPKATEITKDTFKIADIIIKGVTERDAEWLLKLSGLKRNSNISGAEINRAISIFMGTRAFSFVNYMLQKIPKTNSENLHLDFKRGPTNVIGFGARFDSEEAAAILVHLGIHENDLRGSKLGVTARLSYNPYGKVDYTYVSERFAKIDISYMFRSTDMNIYKKSDSRNYLKFYHNNVDISLSNRYLRNFNFQFGVRFETYNYDMLFSTSADALGTKLPSECYLSAFVRAVMDDRDSKYFPTNGMSFNAETNYYHTNFRSSFHKFAALQLNLTGAISVGDRFSFLPAFYSRVIVGNMDETPFLNFFGGDEPGRYIAQQLPFIGINYANIVDKSIAILRLDLRGRIGKKHYIYALSNYARSGADYGEMFRSIGVGYWGVGFKYAYSTPLGPIAFNVHWSDYNYKVGAYVSLGYYF